LRRAWERRGRTRRRSDAHTRTNDAPCSGVVGGDGRACCATTPASGRTEQEHPAKVRAFVGANGLHHGGNVSYGLQPWSLVSPCGEHRAIGLLTDSPQSFLTFRPFFPELPILLRDPAELTENRSKVRFRARQAEQPVAERRLRNADHPSDRRLRTLWRLSNPGQEFRPARSLDAAFRVLLGHHGGA